MSPIPFEDYCARVQERIEDFYKIRVVTRDIPDPLTGDLDGAEIQIDYAETPEQRFFLLAHLFGHTVQWNVNPRAFEMGQPRRPPVNEDLLPEIIDYEREAAAYALWMLHEVGITDVDQWFCDYTNCDRAYLLDYYRTGDKKDFRSFWHDNSPLIPPQPIPAFTPVKLASRLDGIVI